MTEGWGTQDWLLFLRALPKLTPAQMADLDAKFSFTKSGNSEILFAWLMKAVESRYTLAYPALEQFLTSMGRRKFLEPLYEAMVKTPEGMAMAKKIYGKARPAYHPLSQEAVDAIVVGSPQ